VDTVSDGSNADEYDAGDIIMTGDNNDDESDVDDTNEEQVDTSS
jgi:hypothetical protein